MNPNAKPRFPKTGAPARETKAIARFAWAQRRGHLLTVGLSSALVFSIAIGLAARRGTFADEVFTWPFWEPTLQFSILVIAFVVWWGEVAQDWENGLPRRLTVWFLYPRQPADPVQSSAHPEPKGPAGALGQVALLCEEAYLADEGDIRTWGQSIGGQMAKGFLSFEPDIVQTQRRRVWREGDGDFLHYHVLFRLTELPTERGCPPDKRFTARQLLLWERGHRQPVWGDSAFCVETADKWELLRSSDAGTPEKDQ